MQNYKTNKLLIIAAIGIPFLYFSCTKMSGDASKVIAKIGHYKITEAIINAAQNSKPSYARFSQSDKEKKIDFLNKLIESKVLALSAKAAGLQDNPFLKYQSTSMRKRIIQRKYQTEFLEKNGGFTTKRIQKYYESNKSKFKNDSGKVIPLSDAYPKVVDALILQSANIDSFYTAEKSRYQKIIKKDSLHIDTILPPLKEKLETVEKGFIKAYKSKLVSEMKDNLFKKFNVQYFKPKPKISDQELLDFYKSSPQRYMTKKSYDLSHIEFDSETSAKKVMKKIKSMDDFKALAKTKSLNAMTKSAEGHLGFVKRSFCLPYGIGMFPRLFPILDSLESVQHSLKITLPLENPQTKKWHLFALNSVKEKELKPYERVKVLVYQNYIREKGESMAPDAVLATYGKSKKIVENDVIKLRREIPSHYQKRYTRKQLVEYLVLWDVATLEAESLGLLNELNIKVVVDMEMDEYWAQVFKDSVAKSTYCRDIATLQKLYEQNTAYFSQDSTPPNFSNSLHSDVAVFSTLTTDEFKMEYNLYPDKYTKDSALKSFDESRYQLFQTLKRRHQNRPREKMLDSLKAKLGVVVLDAGFKPDKIINAREAFKQAQNLHTDRKLSEAIKVYKNIRNDFPQPEYKSLQDSICMGLAQVHVELEKYKEALAEYRRLLYLYPDSPNNYKAQFMIGFIYSENLKKDNLAIKAFKKLLEKYPKCDLADDADWMIRNIESGGALMPVLEDS